MAKRSVDLVEKFLTSKLKKQKEKVLLEKGRLSRKQESQRNHPLGDVNNTITLDGSTPPLIA